MLRKIYVCTFILFFSHIVCSPFAQAQSTTAKKYVQTSDGVIVYPDTNFSGGVKAVRLELVRENIIRVTASPTLSFPDVKSLITVYTPQKVNAIVTQNADHILLKTGKITAQILLFTGAVSFTDNTGKSIAKERQYNGRTLTPAVFEGQNSYNIHQTFETTNDDAFYGMGQHQNGQFNYKGGQVFLFQNNTEVAIPFLLNPVKNYGILWDNYSLTKAGDTIDFLPLSALKLYSKNDEQGWLTASYSNDKKKPDEIAFTKAESTINYPYLDDTKKNLPTEFAIAKGQVTWEGSIASGFSGLHQFKLTYAGYIKVWLDGKLMVDRWRQPWNPGSAALQFDLQKDKKYPLKIEWVPDGGESYISLNWLPPQPPKDVNTWSFASEAGQQLDYYFIKADNADSIISGYRTLTGKATMVPRWALGFWQSRERYKTQAEILNTVAEFRKLKIPLDNIVQDWSYWKEADWGSQEFDNSRFPNPDSMIAQLHSQYHTQFMISVWPKMYEGIKAYKDFDAKGWLYKRNIADRQRDWIGKGYISTFYDAFNDDAKQGFWNLLNKKLYSKGVDAWWMDASEPDILSNVSPEKRKLQMTPLSKGLAAEYLNAYPLENAKGIYKGQRSVDPNKRVFLLTRSGFAGSQHYSASIWSGDISSTWGDMKTQITAGLNFSMSGLPYWTMDIGGFAVENRFVKPSATDLEEWRELQTRWYQFGAFAPLFRSHGQAPFREIFNIAPEDHPAYKSMLYHNQLRYRLMPYIYSLAGMAYHNDYTMMRGLVMDFPKDTAVRNISDQFLFGPSLLINPIYTYQKKNKSVYLPAGQGWYDLYTGKHERGGKRLNVNAPYDTMPVFVKEGSIIPIGPALQYTAEKKADTITLYVYTGKDASFNLYEDEDVNYNYEKGLFSKISLQYNEALKQLTIGKREGQFLGMLTSRVFKMVWITKDKPRALDFNSTSDQIINYSGEKVVVKLNSH